MHRLLARRSYRLVGEVLAGVLLAAALIAALVFLGRTVLDITPVEPYDPPPRVSVFEADGVRCIFAADGYAGGLSCDFGARE